MIRGICGVGTFWLVCLFFVALLVFDVDSEYKSCEGRRYFYTQLKPDMLCVGWQDSLALGCLCLWRKTRICGGMVLTELSPLFLYIVTATL